MDEEKSYTGEDIQRIVNSMNEEQQDVFYYVVGIALENGKELLQIVRR